MSQSTEKKSKKFRSLTVTLALAFLALSTTVLLISTSLNIYVGFQNQRKVIDVQQQLVAQKAAHTVKEFINDKFNMLISCIDFANMHRVSLEEQKLALEKLFGMEPAFRQLILFDAQQFEVLNVSRLSKMVSGQWKVQIENELFHYTNQGKIYTSSIYIDKITYEPLVILAVPVTNVFGDVNGVVAAELNLKFMWDLLDQIEIGRNGYAYVVDLEGYLIAFQNVSRVLKRENLAYLEEVNEFIKGNESIHESKAEIAKGILGTNVLTTHVHLGQPEWAVVVELPILEAYETVIMTLILSVLVMIFSFALAIVAGVFLSKQMTRSIIELRDATEKIGKGQLATKIDIKSKNEIGELAASFNKMVEDLNNTTVSRDSLLKEVAERKRTEEILADERNLLRTIVDNLPDNIYFKDRECRFLRINRTMAQSLNLSDESQIIGKTEVDFYGEEFGRKCLEEDQRLIETGKPIIGLIESRKLENGEINWTSSSRVPLRDNYGKIVGLVGITREINEIMKAEEQIRTSLKEKEVLLKEIHHRVKNNLQIISSLLYLQSKNIKYEDALELFKESQSRVRSMALIHEKLYQSDDLAIINFAEYIRSLTNYLMQTYRTGTAPIELKISVEDISFTIETAIPCGLIVNELVSNALKYAFPNGKSGEICIDLYSNGNVNTDDEDRKYTLRVSDNGIGFPDDLDFRNTQSLGLRLVNTLTSQLGGTLDLIRDEGTVFKIDFKG